MSTEPEPADAVAPVRMQMAATGAAAGLAAWLFVDVLPDRIANDRLLMVATALVLGGFAVMLALIGPARAVRAALGAAGVAVPAALLLGWASLRFASVDAFLAGAHAVVAYLVMAVVATPFAAAGLQQAGGWRRYEVLFDVSWTIVVRYTAAWLFLGLVWLVLMLSDALLDLVGLPLIETLLDLAAVPWVLSGAVLGLALAVVHEMRDYVSPFLIHRLLRLLVPVLLVVVVVFIAVLPVRGLSGLFGSFSPSATLMAVAFAAITLISTAIDRDDEEAVESPSMLFSVRVLAMAVPVLAGLAVYAVWLRVGQYGWTPDRLMAAAAAAFLLAYGVAYAGAVALAEGWMARIRGANRQMAMALVAVAALWLSPAINAERLSVASQMARIEADPDQPQTAALWEMAHEWGRAGQAGLASLETGVGARGPLARAIAEARRAPTRDVYDQRVRQEGRAEQAARVQAMLALRPEGAPLPQGALAGLSDFVLGLWDRSCRNPLPDGRVGCVMVFGAYRPGVAARQALVLLNEPGNRVRVDAVVLEAGRIRRSGGGRDAGESDGAGSAAWATVRTIAAALDGRFEIAPARLNALRIDGLELIPDN